MRTFKLITPLAAILAVAIGAAPASASTTTPSNTADSGSAIIQGREVTDPATAQALITAYWTPERMRTAIPVDPESVVDSALEAVDRPGRVGREAPVSTPTGPTSTAGIKTPATRSLAVSASPGVGKVFFTKSNGLDYVCSGSTINNPTKNLVNTAGHCVHGGKNKTWHQNWAYVPYYDHGAAPHGIWAAKSFTTVHGWTDHSYSWWDFGFVTMWTNNGVKLVHKTGGNALYFNYSKWIDVTVLAYPSAAPFDGQWQIYCNNNLYPFGSQQVGFNCLMTGGSSGGPFLYQYDNSIRFGYVASNIAHGPDTISYGPYYDDDVRDIYNLVKNKA